MDLRNGDWIMEAASYLILINQTYQTGPIKHELSGYAPFLNLPSQLSMKTFIYS